MKEKINKSAFNFLILLEFLLRKRTFTVDEVVAYFEESFDIYIFRETVLKYIRTFKKLGFKFVRLNNKVYNLIDIPLKVEVNDSEKETILKCVELWANYNIGIDKTCFSETVRLFLPDGLQKEFNEKLRTANYSQNKNLLLTEKLKKYCKDAQRLNIIYLKHGLTKLKCSFEPFDIFVNRNIAYLRGFDLSAKSNLLINIDWIVTVEQTPLRNKFVYKNQYAILKFYSKSAKSYTINEGEEVLEKDEGTLTLRTFYFDKDMFFKKILRYMDTCEIISPSWLRKDFVEYVDELYQMYDCPL